MISKGAPAKFTSHPGSWGDSYVIEKKHLPKRKVTCEDCKHYNSDKSCQAEPVFIPEVGYDNWKNCKSFLLSCHTAYFDEKKKTVVSLRSEKYIETPRGSYEALLRQSQEREDRRKEIKETKDSTFKQGVNYWGIPMEVLGHLKRYYYGYQSEYNYCKKRIPAKTYKAFQRYCMEGDHSEFDEALAQFIVALSIPIPSKEGIVKFRKALQREIMSLLFDEEKDYSLKASRFNRLFVDAFVNLLEKKKCFDIHN